MIDKAKYYQAKLQGKDFQRISRFVEKNYGIRLPKTKLIMVQNRLYKRLISTQIETFEEYVRYIFSPDGKNELNAMIDELTTNKTEFFREKAHFDFLENEIFNNAHGNKTFKIWSAGCSTGEEAYSLAITAERHRLNYEIIATDLSDQALEKAKQGIYTKQSIEHLDKHILQLFFDKKEINNKEYFAVKSYLKNHVNFYKLNLIDEVYNIYNIPRDFDIIFFRNVLIYFSQQTQYKVLTHIIKHLKSNGYLFIGFSETIYNKDLPITRIGPSIYQKEKTLQ